MIQKYYLSGNPEKKVKEVNSSFIPNVGNFVTFNKNIYRIYSRTFCLGNYNITNIEFYLTH